MSFLIFMLSAIEQRVSLGHDAVLLICEMSKIQLCSEHQRLLLACMCDCDHGSLSACAYVCMLLYTAQVCLLKHVEGYSFRVRQAHHSRESAVVLVGCHSYVDLHIFKVKPKCNACMRVCRTC